MSRKKPSLPITKIIDLIKPGGRVIDVGCGKNMVDYHFMKERGLDVVAYDPGFMDCRELMSPNSFEYACNTYILNVIVEPVRLAVLSKLYEILKPGGKAYITVRDTSEKVNGAPFEDGVLTRRKTFQKLFKPEELVELVGLFFPEVKIISRRQPLIVEATKGTEANKMPLCS